MTNNKRNKIDTILQRSWWVVSIFAGIASIFFAAYQININKKLVLKSLKADQPVFQVHFNYWQSDTSSIKDHVDVWIGAKGEEPRIINDINIDSYLKFDYTNNPRYKNDVYYIPIKNYFGWPLLTNNLSDTIAFTYTCAPNNADFARIYHEAMDSTKGSEYLFVEMLHITQIDYIDKYGESQKVYFINKKEVTEKEALQIKQISQTKFPYEEWSIDALSIKKIKEICGIK